MNKLSLTNYTKYPNLVILLRGLTVNSKKVAIIDESQECLLNFLGPYLLQMNCEHKVYRKPMLQEELFDYKPEIIICFYNKCFFTPTLCSFYKEKNIIIISILKNNNCKIKECKIPLLEIEIFSVASRQTNIVYLNNPEQCHKDISNLKQYVMVRVQ